MEQRVRTMMQLIKDEVFGTATAALSFMPDDAALDKLYRLSKFHDVAHLVGSALDRQRLLPDNDIGKQFKKQVLLAAYRYEQFEYEYQRICDVLEDAEITFVPLKGAVIRPFYPEPWMRTSCDIDILIKESDLDRAVAALTAMLEYTADETRHFHDVSLYSKSGVHLELHFSILEGMERIDRILENVWDYVKVAEGKRYLSYQTNEYVVFHTVAHMLYHFLRGGCGVRPLIDLYLLQNKLKYDAAVLRTLITKCRMDKFFDAVTVLIDVWFADKPHTPLTRKMEEYLLSGGVYGTKKNNVTVAQGKRGGKLKYVFSRIFLPYHELKMQYSALEKHKWLTPFYQVRRWCRLLCGGRFKHGGDKLNTVQDIEAQAVIDLLTELEL